MNRQEILNLARDIYQNKASLIPLENTYSISKGLDKPVVRSVFKSENEIQIAFGVVGVIVQRFFDSLGFSTKVSPVQVEIITADALENFQYETLDDIILFFKYCRQGKFGSTHRGVDSNLLFGEWLPKYMELKADEREKQKQKEKSDFIKSDEESVVNKFYKKKYEEKKKKLIQDSIEKEIDNLVKNMDKQMLEDTISDWEKKPELSYHLKYLKTKRLLFR